jgi:hypothetical protein
VMRLQGASSGCCRSGVIQLTESCDTILVSPKHWRTHTFNCPETAFQSNPLCWCDVAHHRGNGEQAAAAARANTIMRRADTPAPAMSPARCRNMGCDTTA